MNGHATIKDIARRLNISPSTVSRALSDHCDISKKTKNKVLKLAHELNYQPNSIAQSLKTNKTRVVGLIVPALQNYFFPEIVSTIEEVFFRAGFTIIVCQSNESYERELLNIQVLTSNRVAGLLAAVSQTTKNFDHFKQLKKMNIPLVLFDRDCDGVDAPLVTVDNYSGAVAAVRYLLSCGYKKIAHLAGLQHVSTAEKRYKAYCDVLHENRIPYRSDYVPFGSFFESDGYTNTGNLLQLPDPPEAIFAVNDTVAFGAYKKIKERGLSIPDDIALVGYDDVPFMQSLDPPITTVRQPMAEIGRQAANLLLEQMGCPYDQENMKTVLQPELIVRDSVVVLP
ncbi:LacI family DNA-binding transcriptional regulator [candidate division KSB1 bacterium]|nr:LacI family DNA-binding transcriptional regulator [candidate division KSB1 bacterium]